MLGAPVRSIKSSQNASRNRTANSQKAEAEITTSELPRQTRNATAQPRAMSAAAKRPALTALARCTLAGVMIRRTCSMPEILAIILRL